MNTKKILEKLGLTKHESAIYLALLELGTSNISQISEKTSIHRPLIYKAIPSLLEKKLITKTQKLHSVVYGAEPPNRLEALFDDLRIDFFESLPDLEDAYAASEKKPKIRFLEGKNGTKRVFEDVVRSLKKGDTFYRFSSNKDGNEKKDKHLPRIYRQMRDEKKLQRLAITNDQTAANKKPSLDRFVKVMPKDFGQFEHNVTEIIYGNKVAFIDYNTETAMIIESKRIAEFQKQIFQTFYSKI
ncbi:MAG: helix-turn-helix domain-containing protein [Candidatus Pacebacteria bacterium]|nr:helix-turn-helix domain-containing protein [Candidatus Paceibacterota bacterium]